MEQQHTERIVGAILEAHPRPALDRLLAYLVRLYAAEGALVCYDDGGGGAVVEMVRTMRADHIAGFDAIWRAHRPRMVAGEVVQGDGFVLAALNERQAMVGGLFLDRPRHFDLDGFDYYRFVLAAALVAAKKDSNDASPSGIVVDQKAVLLLLLERHEWNISRATREMGVTRRTVYLRMVKYNVRRRHVPKTVKRLP